MSGRAGPLATAALAAMFLHTVATPFARQGLRVDVTARALQPGELVLLTVTADGPLDTLAVRAFGRDERPWRVDARTWRVLVGLDLDVTPGVAPVALTGTSAGRTLEARQNLAVTARRFPTRRLTVDDAFVNPPAEVTARIASEAALLRARWMDSSPERLWEGAFVRPVPHAANSAFGTRSVFNNQPRSPHSGADFLSPAGTPVRAPANGRTVLARDLYYTGGTVLIDHGLGLMSLLAHLSTIEAREGTMVSAGAVVGRSGATGRVTGAHLHWTVRAGTARIDPLSLLAVLGETRAGAGS